MQGMDDIDFLGPQSADQWSYRGQDGTDKRTGPMLPMTPAMSGREEDMRAQAAETSEQEEMLWQRLIGFYVRELDKQAAWRQRMGKDEAFYDGDQISDEDRAIYEARGQLPITYNVIGPAVNWMLGQERRARSQPRILARSKAGTRHAEHKTKLLKYVYDQSQGEMATSMAYRDAVRSGLGWIESGFRGFDDDEEPVFMGYEAWRNILHDSLANEYDFRDARFMFRTRWGDTDLASRLFTTPSQRATIAQASIDGTEYLSDFDFYGDEFMDIKEMQASESHAGRDAGDGRRQRVRLIEAWYRRPVDTDVMVGGEFNGLKFMPEHRGHAAMVENGHANVQRRVKMRMHVAIMTSRGLLHNQESPYLHNRYPFTPIVGNIKAGTGEPYGVIRNLVDIQIDVNRRAGKALQLITDNKVYMDKDAYEGGDLDDLADEMARPDAIITLKKGARFEPGKDRELAPAHMDMFARGILMIQSISGVTDENMGRSTNATSGRAIIARQDQGTTTTWHYVDNLRYCLRSHGEKMLSLVEQYFTEEKSFRITNQRGTPDYQQVNDGMPENDIAATRADFVVSEDEWKASIRQQQVQDLLGVLQQLAPVAPQLVFALLDLLIEAMDVPSKDALVSRIRGITGQEDPDADPDAADPETIARRESKQIQMQMEQRHADAEISTKEAEAKEKEAKAFKANADGLRSAHGMSLEQINLMRAALETAVLAMNSRPAAGVADGMMAEAESLTTQAMMIAAQKSGAAPPPQQQQQPQMPADPMAGQPPAQMP